MKTRDNYTRLQETITQLTWRCPHCETTHAPKMLLAHGRPDLNWNEIVYPNRCVCPKSVLAYKSLLAEQQRQSDLEHKHKLENHPLWQEFDTDWPKSSDARLTLRQAKERVMASHLNQLPGNGLLITGQYGCGKTMLLEAVAQANDGLVLLEYHLKTALVANNADSILNRCISKKVLLIDDIGSEDLDSDKASWLKGMLSNFYTVLLGKREADKSKKTYFTTNCPYETSNSPSSRPPLIDKIGERAFSRLEGIIKDIDNWVDLWNVPSYRSRNFTGL